MEPTDSSPSASAGASASSPIPIRRAAAPTSIGSPSGSAAAISSISPVSAGSASTRRRKLASIRRTSSGASGIPKPPASSALDRPRVELEQGQRVASCLSHDPSHNARISGPWMTWPSSAWHRDQAVRTPSARRPASSPLSSTSRGSETRAGPTPPADGDPRTPTPGQTLDRATGRRQSTRRPAAPPGLRQEIEDRQPDQKSIRDTPDTSPNAAPSASRRGPGSRSSPPSSGETSWWRPAYASSISACTPAACSTRQPDARSTTYSRSDDLPTPGSPRTTSVPLRLADGGQHPVERLTPTPTTQDRRCCHSTPKRENVVATVHAAGGGSHLSDLRSTKWAANGRSRASTLVARHGGEGFACGLARP